MEQLASYLSAKGHPHAVIYNAGEKEGKTSSNTQQVELREAVTNIQTNFSAIN